MIECLHISMKDIRNVFIHQKKQNVRKQTIYHYISKKTRKIYQHVIEISYSFDDHRIGKTQVVNTFFRYFYILNDKSLSQGKSFYVRKLE